MRGHADEWVEKRMLWKLSKSPTAFSSAYLFSKNDFRFPASLSACEGVENLGIPVFAFLATESWSLFGSNKIVSSHKGVLSEVEIDALHGFDEPQSTTLPKDQRNMIQIIQEDGKTNAIWAGAGETYGAVGGLLLMLERMKKRIK